jgi:hypothetical protein
VGAKLLSCRLGPLCHDGYVQQNSSSVCKILR